MANDASIKHIDELAVYSNHLQDFCDSMMKNGSVYSNLMAQKLEELQKKKKEAEDLVKELSAAAIDAENALAYRHDDDDRVVLLRVFQELHDRSVRARELLGEINLMIVQAQGAVRCIIEKTRSIQNDVKVNIEQGRTMLKKSQIQLEQYREGNSKL